MLEQRGREEKFSRTCLLRTGRDCDYEDKRCMDEPRLLLTNTTIASKIDMEEGGLIAR